MISSRSIPSYPLHVLLVPNRAAVAGAEPSTAHSRTRDKQPCIQYPAATSPLPWNVPTNSLVVACRDVKRADS